MVKLPEGKAKNLKQAFQLCDVGPLKGELLDRFYVDLSAVRNQESIGVVKTRLDFLEPGEFTSVLFTGHRGCGKSTELRRLQSHWEQSYRVIYLESDNEIDIHDADYTDLYLVIIKQITDDLAQMQLSFDSHLLGEFQKWFLEITEETEESVEKSMSIAASAEAGLEIPFLSKLLTKVLAQIKGSNVQKQKIRAKLQQDIGKLKDDLNQLLLNAFELATKQGYEKGYLVIFDNLDRMPLDVGDRLYFDHATQLQELNCTLIYTVPISVVYSPKNLNNAFGQPNVMPMINIYDIDQANGLDLTYNTDALQALVLLIAERVEYGEVFAEAKLISKLVRASGGHIRQLMSMTARTCLTAASRGHAKVEAADVDYAIRQEQINFERVVPAHHYPLLVNVCKTKQIDQTDDGQMMLFNISVLEYETERRWNYINPVIKNSIFFKEAVAKSEEDTA